MTFPTATKEAPAVGGPTQSAPPRGGGRHPAPAFTQKAGAGVVVVAK